MSNYQPQPPRQSNPQQRNRGFESRDDNFYEANRFDTDDYELDEPQGRDSWRDRQSAHIDERFGREAYWQGGNRDRNSGAYGLNVASSARSNPYPSPRPQNYREDVEFQSNRNPYQGPRSQRGRYQSGNFAGGNPHAVYETAAALNAGRGYYGGSDEGTYRNYGGANWEQSYADLDYAPTQRGQFGNRALGDASPDSRSPYGGQNYRQPQGFNPDRQINPSYHTEDFTGGGWISYDDSGINNRGRAPKGYARSDERVHEDICEHLAHDRFIDASDITVTVKAGVVTLEGTIDDRRLKHRVEDIADSCSGVKDVQNRLTVARAGREANNTGENRSNGGALNQPGNEATGGQKVTRQ